MRLNTEADRVETTPAGKTVHLKGGGSVTAAEILVGIGRKPNVDGLGLEAAGVTYDERTGVEVDDSLKTSNPKIYAAGDVCFKLKFTHAADFLARTLIRTGVAPSVPLVGGAKASDLVIPWCTYTSPELAHVGLTAAGAKQNGVEIDTLEQPFAEVDRAILESADGDPRRVRPGPLQKRHGHSRGGHGRGRAGRRVDLAVQPGDDEGRRAWRTSRRRFIRTRRSPKPCGSWATRITVGS